MSLKIKKSKLFSIYLVFALAISSIFFLISINSNKNNEFHSFFSPIITNNNNNSKATIDKEANFGFVQYQQIKNVKLYDNIGELVTGELVTANISFSSFTNVDDNLIIVESFTKVKDSRVDEDKEIWEPATIIVNDNQIVDNGEITIDGEGKADEYISINFKTTGSGYKTEKDVTKMRATWKNNGIDYISNEFTVKNPFSSSNAALTITIAVSLSVLVVVIFLILFIYRSKKRRTQEAKDEKLIEKKLEKLEKSDKLPPL